MATDWAWDTAVKLKFFHGFLLKMLLSKKAWSISYSDSAGMVSASHTETVPFVAMVTACPKSRQQDSNFTASDMAQISIPTSTSAPNIRFTIALPLETYRSKSLSTEIGNLETWSGPLGCTRVTSPGSTFQLCLNGPLGLLLEQPQATCARSVQTGTFGWWF